MKLEPSDVFRALGVETRLRIVELLKTHGPMGANEIASHLSVTAAAVSQHLKILRYLGLVKSERKGQWIPYSLDREALESCRRLVEEVCTCGCLEMKAKEVCPSAKDLDSLQDYEKYLKNELRIVQAKIKELEAQH
jgi:ArsR family transcriptional regulator, arsenate/arsenite/antimonite-responsive transcriptional repressor